MSGHSKWSTIKRKKGAADAKRGKIFTKLIREIATAARLGGGRSRRETPDCGWPSTRPAQANMPKDNIERAIQKGTGGGEERGLRGGGLRGLWSRGDGHLLETLTDNRNRTVSEVRHVLTKNGGNLGSTGCVAYLFDKKGLLVFEREGIDGDALMEAALEAGADDVIESEDSLEVITGPGEFEAVKTALTDGGFAAAQAEITFQPSTTVKLEGQEAEAMLRVADALEDLDDVQNVHANFDISEEEMARIVAAG